MDSREQEEIVEFVAAELARKGAAVQNAIEEARAALAAADAALCNALALMGVPTRPAAVSPIRKRRPRG